MCAPSIFNDDGAWSNVFMFCCSLASSIQIYTECVVIWLLLLFFIVLGFNWFRQKYTKFVVASYQGTHQLNIYTNRDKTEETKKTNWLKINSFLYFFHSNFNAKTSFFLRMHFKLLMLFTPYVWERKYTVEMKPNHSKNNTVICAPLPTLITKNKTLCNR